MKQLINSPATTLRARFYVYTSGVRIPGKRYSGVYHRRVFTKGDMKPLMNSSATALPARFHLYLLCRYMIGVRMPGIYQACFHEGGPTIGRESGTETQFEKATALPALFHLYNTLVHNIIYIYYIIHIDAFGDSYSRYRYKLDVFTRWGRMYGERAGRKTRLKSLKRKTVEYTTIFPWRSV